MQQYLDYLRQLPAGVEKMSFDQYCRTARGLEIEEFVEGLYAHLTNPSPPPTDGGKRQRETQKCRPLRLVIKD